MLSNIYFSQLHLESLGIDYAMVLPSYKLLQFNEKYIWDWFSTLDEKEHPPDVNNVLGNIRSINDLINWGRFIFLENDKSRYCGILDLAEDLDCVLPYSHPGQPAHDKYANELRRRIF